MTSAPVSSLPPVLQGFAYSAPLPLPMFQGQAALPQLLAWANGHTHYALYNGNDIDYRHGAFPVLLAVGCHRSCPYTPGQAFSTLQQHLDQHPGWWFGYLGYDLKNELEALQSQHQDAIGFAPMAFWQAQHVLCLHHGQWYLYSHQPVAPTLHAIENAPALPPWLALPNRAKVQPGMSRTEYVQKVQRLQQHIVEGDVYEVNLCMEFLLPGLIDNLPGLYLRLNELSPTPFSCLLKQQGRYLLCASPERFLKKQGQQLISQPIKGTAPRGSTPAQDQQMVQQLANSEKERAENMMIVDLVRNDLARSAVTGSTRATHLFEIRPFKQVHQMISTVEATLPTTTPLTQALAHAFPMGSMTGAPKIMAMQLIEQYENARRGLYSGAVGFIDPAGNFDFNVVIRAMQYNESSQTLAWQVGSAITFDAHPEAEYQECLLKASAIEAALFKD